MESLRTNTVAPPATTVGYKLGVFGVVLVLLWIGIFKFTPTEAAAIEPLIKNHPLMGWTYHFFSVQTVSNLVGLSEIVVAIGLIYGFFNPRVGYFSGLIASAIFIVTLSFLFTTPNTWKIVDSVPVANFFLVKDILFLAIAIMVVEHNKKLLAYKLQ
ncbi:DUF417 family protein [Photobacterium piscicola]|uniref:DUF417 family protein n=1 Tax=Photobacterium piscicola TaxID=1378299 RepID=UPI002E19EFDA|nr:DUF417 family protein [Photobacterium piscicola]MEC6881439.1 DUF417 family protein [Photobacterium piscicola]